MIQKLLQNSINYIPWELRGIVKRFPLISIGQRWILAKFLEGREFVHIVDAGPARGLKYPITLPEDKGIWTGAYEVELSKFIAKEVRNGDVCFDIGGWHGFFGGVMALAGASKVFIFEPLPANIAQIARVIELNPNLSLKIVKAAVGLTDGVHEFIVMPETSMGKLTDSSFQTNQRDGQKISVQVVGLDELLAIGSVPTPSVLKIDVEGAELLVLKGAKNLLTTHKPKLFIEIHSRELAQDCLKVLDAYGYEVLVVETMTHPNGVLEPEVCHYFAKALMP